jgi:hypothetical protein
MESEFVQIGVHVINLAAVAGVHWEARKLFVHLIGGRFVSFTGKEAEQLWQVMQGRAVALIA